MLVVNVDVRGARRLERETSGRPEDISASGSATGEHGCCFSTSPPPLALSIRGQLLVGMEECH